jgi:hypothetical protein
MRAALARFWADDRGLSLFLASLGVVVFVLPPLLPTATLGRLLTDTFLSLMLVSGAAASAERRWVRTVIAAIALAALIVRWGSWLVPEADLEVWRDVSVLATLLSFCLVISHLVLRGGPVTRRRIEGAIALYLLIGLTCGQAYALLARGHPGAFAGATGGGGLSAWIYYSFVTLTTIGYGDITPVHPTARSLAMLEGLIGQLYPAILLARLVSLELHSRQRDEDDASRAAMGMTRYPEASERPRADSRVPQQRRGTSSLQLEGSNQTTGRRPGDEQSE